jgi:hypothetical protein
MKVTKAEVHDREALRVWWLTLFACVLCGLYVSYIFLAIVLKVG